MSSDTYTPDGLEQMPLRVFAEKAYLDYSMYVILDRALPHIGDGLKPVQRRIVYAMSELRLNAAAKPMKSARSVGDVMGKYHPHGDSAIYEAMVLMAQDFSYRYPLVDGQGNWGSSDDPKSFAAMRYTESRLTPYAEVLLSELAQGTVDWVASYDGKEVEPARLPARLPNLLLNGTSGIAVGMATDIPPHNLREVANACIHLLDQPEATLAEVMHYLPGPDFPVGAEIITPASELERIYRTGGGSLRMRACWENEQGDIVITVLPHQTSGARVLEQIAAQMQARKLPMIEDLRDESDHENPTRLVIVPRSNRVDQAAVMSHLFATTDLERSYRVNLNMIGLDGRPAVKGLLEILREWLEFRYQTVRRRLEHRLRKVLERLHLLDGLLIALLNIDEVIRIIRSEDRPKPVLMERFDLSELQADYVLDTRLRQLARLEEMKIRAEQQELADEREWLDKTLASKQRMKTLIKKEIRDDAERHGDARRCRLVERPIAEAMDETRLVPSEPITVVLSEKGWVRAAKGHELDATSLGYKSGDGFLAQVRLRSNQPVIFLDSAGRSYSLPAHTLPSARGQGEPLTGRLSPAAGEQFVQILAGEPEQLVLLASDAGFGFITEIANLYAKNKSGKALLTLPRKARVLPPVAVRHPETDQLIAITNEGRMLVFAVAEMPRLARGKGNRIINIPSDRAASRNELLIWLRVIPHDAPLTLLVGKRKLTLRPTDLDAYRHERGRRGSKLPRGLQRVDAILDEGEGAGR